MHRSFKPSDRELLLVPQGQYTVKCHGWVTGMYFGKQPKMVLECTIADMGAYFEFPLQRHFNVQRLIGKPGKSGRCAVGRSSDCLREFVLIAGRRPDRLDRMPLTEFQKRILVVDVVTVERSRDGSPVPDLARYSVIKRIVGVQ
jgi:hypothetical protein